MPFLVLFLLITVICLISFCMAVAYLILGIRSLTLGRRQKSRTKTISGYNAIFISGTSMVAL